MRKQSLHILKRVLCISGGSQYNSGFSEDKLQRKHPGHGMTKRELWADKEAKSLGVGKLCGVAESGFNSQQQWEAFLLLYEMLDEYGTHLVDAAWNHQVLVLMTVIRYDFSWFYYRINMSYLYTYTFQQR